MYPSLVPHLESSGGDGAARLTDPKQGLGPRSADGVQHRHRKTIHLGVRKEFEVLEGVGSCCENHTSWM